jgi:seryl-tRNA synthetase
MHDIKAIRVSPAVYDAGWAKRNLAAQTPEILAADERTRAIQTELQTLQSSRNDLSKQIGQIKAKGGDAAELTAKVAAMKDDMARLEGDAAKASEKLFDLLSSLPNIMQDDVPVGRDEHQNVVVHKFGTPGTRNENPDHTLIGETLKMMDAETAAKMSGSRFTFLYAGLARLERALGQFMLDTHVTEHGYTEISPPLMVRDNAMFGVGQLPKFREDMFRTNTDHWLITTAEVVLTNIVNDMIMEEERLPLRLTAMTPCFRSEAGAAGKDTKGMIRQHQFQKVEMVSITTPEASRDEHERMTNCAENILKKLELPFQRLLLCTGDSGFSSQKTYDLEVWLPGQGRYREISSCSNCGDFQARRMMARTRKAGTKDTRFVHTLNGSGIAIGRTLIAVLENYYNPADGSVTIPNVLRPYMGKLEKIMPLSDNEELIRPVTA